ncbi:D-cysteine desulfhydrase family protein [Sphingomonas cannabina]|uniref:D-cysteine desulfhydrase family protein n=1 Tax=Sphingomonas cannabina TaxID=2899123 RepID=UPI001F3F46D3|nr:D-cysteine desulfhydrase family protein [Sphingomonas cannabina]UIJ46430.1 D-cysteine desulfhydrase family protein [Sphingomonas cannabina]
MDLEAALRNRPRTRLIDGPTPIQRLHRIEEALGEAAKGVALYAKRDDLTPIGGGGNKLRKLEFLLGAAIADGADTFITVGARQSNHARLSAAAAARVGLAAELVLTRSVPREEADYTENGNVLLDELFGATIHDLPGSADSLAYAEERAATLRREGRKVHVAPSGGSSPVGCLGYAACADEIVRQSEKLGVEFDRVIVANGSAGTHAGLAAGYAALGRSPAVVTSYAVLADEEASRRTTIDKARATLALIDAHAVIDEEAVDVIGDERGPGYGIPTYAMVEAVRLMARAEGLLLDPVYSGKAFAGLLAAVRDGAFAPGSHVLFVMTGGTPGLFAYRSTFRPAA